MNMSTLCTIKYMNRSYISKARYMIGVGFKILGRTPVPKLPPSYPPPHRVVLASGIETHRFESGGASRDRRGIMRGGLTALSLVGG